MFQERSPNQRASRVAIAGSIYMRKASLQLLKPRQIVNQNFQGLGRRNISFGKIVKNSSRRIDVKNSQQLFIASRKAASPVPQRKNLLASTLQMDFSRRTPTPSFGHFDQINNSKIKAIQSKYRDMLSDYEIKKKAINQQLHNIRSSNTCKQIDLKRKDSYQKLRRVEKQQHLIRKNKVDKKVEELPLRNNENKLKQYQTHKKQTIIQKLSINPSSTIQNMSKQNLKNSKLSTTHKVSASQNNQKVLKQNLTNQLIVQKLSTEQKSFTTSKKKQKITQSYPSFFKNLKSQIALQQQLRNIKTCIPTQKKADLEKYLLQKKQSKYLKLLDVHSEQFDPFQNINKNKIQLTVQGIATKLISKFNQCEKHWKQNVCNLSNKRQAKHIFESLNFEKSGQITLKAFVRQMSYLLQKHLRNRDLIRIYERFVPFTETNFSEVITSSKNSVKTETTNSQNTQNKIQQKDKIELKQ